MPDNKGDGRNREMEFIEKTITDNKDNITKLNDRVTSVERDVSRLTTSVEITNQSVTAVNGSIQSLNSEVTTLNANVKNDFKEVNKNIQDRDERFYKQQIEQMNDYKRAIWTVGTGVIGSVVTAIVLLILNL